MTLSPHETHSVEHNGDHLLLRQSPPPSRTWKGGRLSFDRNASAGDRRVGGDPLFPAALTYGLIFMATSFTDAMSTSACVSLLGQQPAFTDLTTQHLLNLPPLLHSISPTLAALHLARARLYLSISSAELYDGWCYRCGGLREGGGSKSAIRKKRKLPRDRSLNEHPTCANAPRVDANEGKDHTGVKRRATSCTVCGASFRQARPDSTKQSSFPPARPVRQTRLKAAQRQEQDTAALVASATSVDTPIPTIDPSTTLPRPNHSGGMDVDITDGSLARAVTGIRVETTPQSQAVSRNPPNLFSRPSISHVLSAPPSPPTYTQPPPLVPPEKKKGTRKKKKSGLAKLLAENKERAERDQGSSWGLL